MVATFPRVGRDVIVATGHSGGPLAGSGRVTLAATPLTVVPALGCRSHRDRVEALGGKLLVDSPAGGGTTLQVEIPLAVGSSA